jgi:nitroreductase
MDTLECIKTRRSVRKFSDSAVEWEKVGVILEAGMIAPSSGNLQNWRFIVVTSEGLREKIAEASLQQKWMAEAPVHIVVCAESAKAEQFYGIRGERLYSIQNCAAAIENMLLATHAQGLASCWVGAFDEEMLKRALGIPDDVRPQAILPVGYASESPRDTPRGRLYDKVFINSWGGRVLDIQHVLGYHSAKLHKAVDKTNKTITKGLQKGSDFLKGLSSRKKSSKRN